MSTSNSGDGYRIKEPSNLSMMPQQANYSQLMNSSFLSPSRTKFKITYEGELKVITLDGYFTYEDLVSKIIKNFKLDNNLDPQNPKLYFLFDEDAKLEIRNQYDFETSLNIKRAKNQAFMKF